MAITVTLCVCTADDRTMDKTGSITTGLNVSAQIKDGCSIVDPVFVISASSVSPQLNYIHVEAWGRWYFVRNIVYAPGQQAEIQAHVDVLHTYRAAISNLSCSIKRQRADLDPLVRDGQITIKSNRQCETIAFDRTPFVANYATDRVYVLTVLGGVNNVTNQ